MSTDSNKKAFWLVGIAGQIHWSLEPDGLHEFDLCTLDGWSILTPYGYALAHRERSRAGSANGAQPGLRLLATDKVFLSGPPGNAGDNRRMLFDAVPELLRRLRWCSFQATIPRVVTGVTPLEEAGREIGINAPSDLHRIAIRDYLARALVTVDHVRELSKTSSEFVPPVHDDVYLDAVEAFVERDYRKAILYAAIAVEALAKTALDDAYERARARGVDDSRFRFVTRTIRDGEELTDDAVYKHLASGDHFKRLMHERPLYILGRSLMYEDRQLYKGALRLYATRNKIAHLGYVPPGDKVLESSRTGAEIALDIASQLFGWFGNHRAFPITGNMVYADDPSTVYPGMNGG